MSVHPSSDTEVDKVADKMAGMVADVVTDKNLFLADMELDMVANKEVDKVANMLAGHGCWLIGPKLFRPEHLSQTCVSSKLFEFITY